MRPKAEVNKNAFAAKLEEEGLKKRRVTSTPKGPQLFPDLVWVWEFFNLLNRQRQVGQNGPQPTSLSDINALCQMRQITRSDDIEFLLYVIPSLDAVVLKDYYDELEKKAKKPPKGKKTK